MVKWKCRIKCTGRDFTFSAPDEDLIGIFSTMAERQPVESGEGNIKVSGSDLIPPKAEGESIHWSEILFFSFEKKKNNL